MFVMLAIDIRMSNIASNLVILIIICKLIECNANFVNQVTRI